MFQIYFYCDIMVSELRKTVKRNGRTNGKRRIKSLVKLHTPDPIEVRIDGLHIAHTFLAGPKAKDPKYKDVRIACEEALWHGLQHNDSDVWVVAQKLFEDLKRRKRI